MTFTVNSNDSRTLIHEPFFRLIFENAAVGIAQVGNDGKLLMVNNKLAEITGYTKEELLTKTFGEFTHPDDLDADLMQAEALFRGDINTFSMEKRYIRKDGTIVWGKLNASALFNDNGKFISFIGIIEDITEKKNTEAELQEKHRQITRILNNITDCYIKLDRNWKFLEINKTAEQDIFHQPASRLMGKVFWDLYPAGKNNIFHREYEKAFRENVPVHFEARSNVTDKWLEVHAYPAGECLDIFFRDITPRKKLEEELHTSLQHYKIASSAAKIGSYYRNLLTGENYWSPEFLALFGLKPDDSLPLNDGIPEAVHPDDIDMVRNLAHQHYDKSNNTEFSSDHRIVLPDGTIRWLNVRGVTERDSNKKPFKTYGIAMDITAQKLIEIQLRKNEERFRKTFQTATVGVFFFDPEGKFLDANDAFLRLIGYSREELEQGNINTKKVTLPEWMPRTLQAFEELRDTGRLSPYEKQLIRPDGTRWWGLFAGTRLSENESVKFVIDITERKAAEEALQKSEEKYRALFISIDEGFCLCELLTDEQGNPVDYRWLEINPTWEQQTGLKAPVGRTALELVPNLEKHWIETYGKVAITGVPVRFQQESKAMGRWFDVYAFRVNEPHLLQFGILFSDITERIQAERRLKYNNKLVEDLLYISAHDLKGPVANLHGALDLMDSMPMDKKVMFLNRFRELADQLDSTIQGITDILRMRDKDKSAATDIDVDSLLKKVLAELNHPLPQDAVRCRIERSSIKYIEVFLYSILKNLLSNAIKYCRDDVPLRIEICTRISDEYTLLSISDNGQGIDLDVYAGKLFSPFQRIKAGKTKGTGIGLYLIKDIIEKNGGFITVESTPGNGATFNCYLKEY